MFEHFFTKATTALVLGLSTLVLQCMAVPAPPMAQARSLAMPAKLVRRTSVPTGVKPSCQELFVGKKDTDGTVCLTVSGGNLVVKFSSVTGFTYDEVHLSITTEPPTKNAPGSFNMNSYCSISSGGTSATCTIPLDDLPSSGANICDTTFYIASHAAVTSSGGAHETGWGSGTCFGPGGANSNCARYSTFKFDCHEPTPTPSPTPCGGGTAYGFIEGATKFEGPGGWGWYITTTVGDLSSGGFTATLFMGAGQGDTNKGTNVGTVSASISNSGLHISYSTVAPYQLGTTHVYVSTENPGGFVPPGQMGFQNGATYTITTGDKDSSTKQKMTYLTVSSTPLYIILHAEITCSSSG